MRRSVRELFSREVCIYILHLPLIILSIRNWIAFILTHAGILKPRRVFHFRNGTKLAIESYDDCATIYVVFIKREYGQIKDNSVIIDIGSNIGMFSVFAATTSAYSHIYAFEPLPGTYRQLRKNIHINKLSSTITTYEKAVTSKVGKKPMFLSNSSPFNSLYNLYESQKKTIIKCTTLSRILKENQIDQCDLLKIDCEGSEYEILYSTPPEYLRRIHEIRMEFHDIHNVTKKKNHTFSVLNDFLVSNGYTLVKLSKDTPTTGIAWFRLRQ